MKKEVVIQWLVFSLIFIVYFSSSVGLMNSVDTPQFFTTEAIIKYGNLNMEMFRDDPHYFVYPDYWIHNHQHLNMRGYMVSILSVPLHLFSSKIQAWYNQSYFPDQVVTPRFYYELSIVSLFTIFSALGMGLMYILLSDLTKNRLIAFILTAGLSFGTYVWKYSSTYARHGLSILLLASVLFGVNKLNQRIDRRWLLLISICLGISFGVDLILFNAMALGLIVLFLMLTQRGGLTVSMKRTCLISLLGPALAIVVINIVFNLCFYGSVLGIQNTKNVVLSSYPLSDQQMRSAWISTPIFPTLLHVLGGFSPLPERVFGNYLHLPKIYGDYCSINYAKKYNFYGIFFISPFLLWGVYSLFEFDRKFLPLMSFVITCFLTGIVISSKILCFWGGNQYDVRYFYPYMIVLLVPTALTISRVSSLRNNFMKIVVLSLFMLTLLFSILMGWLGVLNMYRPALTGERKIWMDIFNISDMGVVYSWSTILEATFINIRNVHVPIICLILIFILLIIGKYLVSTSWFKRSYRVQKLAAWLH